MRYTSILTLLTSTTIASATVETTPPSTETPSKDIVSKKDEEVKKEGTVAVSSSAPASPEGTSGGTTSSAFTSTQQEELKKLIKEEISKNPETIMKTVQAYGEEQQKVALKQEAEKLSKFSDELTEDKTAIISGNPTGTIKLVVFSDPNCGHCRHFENEINTIKGEFNNVKILMRPWAIRGQESVDVINGMVALNTKDPIKFEEVSKKITSSQEPIDKSKFKKMVTDVNLDPKVLKQLEDKDVIEGAKKIIDSNKELAEKKLGLTGTPSVFLIDKSGLQIIMPGDKDSLRKLLTDAKI